MLLILKEKEVDIFGQDNTFKLLVAISRIYNELQQKKNSLDFRKEDINSTPDYTHLYAGEVQKVIQWYHKEYEVLPLWYKRFGHIIKVFMGKRTFKSLFE